MSPLGWIAAGLRAGRGHRQYILKQFIDVVSQPGMVFAFDLFRRLAALAGVDDITSIRFHPNLATNDAETVAG